jgi:hypothetical protein
MVTKSKFSLVWPEDWAYRLDDSDLEDEVSGKFSEKFFSGKYMNIKPAMRIPRKKLSVAIISVFFIFLTSEIDIKLSHCF